MRKGLLTLVLTCLSGAMLLAQADRVRAQQPSETQIIDALKPKATTRGLTRSLGGGAPAPNPAEKRFIDSIRSKPTRSITVEERTQVAKIAETKPGIDLEIYFDFNSWAITPKAMPTLITLGRALSNPEFKGATFLVGGHTDAKGSHEYNKELSEKRAEAVKRFLVENFKVSVDTLMPIGFGKEQLKNKADPYADENRRVQVVNMTAQ